MRWKRNKDFFRVCLQDTSPTVLLTFHDRDNGSEEMPVQFTNVQTFKLITGIMSATTDPTTPKLSEMVLKHRCLPKCLTGPRIMSLSLGAGADSGEAIWSIAPLKPTKVTLFNMFFLLFGNSIRDVKPFCRPLFCHSRAVKYTSSL